MLPEGPLGPNPGSVLPLGDACPASCGLHQLRTGCQRNAALCGRAFTHLQVLGRCLPNAGLPNAMGEYGQSPWEFSGIMKEFASREWVNLIGGCCGTIPEHIRVLKESLKDMKPRMIPEIPQESSYSGLEPLRVTSDIGFLMIGERTNVTGSPKFKKLVLNHDFENALTVARQQVEAGANLIDTNFAEALLDG